MNFLDNLVISQADYNLNLLNIVLIVAMSIMIGYSAYLYGSVLLSIIFRLKSKDNNDDFYSAAVGYYRPLTDNIMYPFGLGFIPFVSVILIYIQLLNKSNTDVTNNLFIAFIMYVLGLIFVYLPGKTVTRFKKSSPPLIKIPMTAFTAYCILGLLMFTISFLIMFTMTSYASHTGELKSNVTVFSFYSNGVIRLFQFVTFAIAFSSIGYLFRNYAWTIDNGKKRIQIKNIFDLNILIAIISSLIVAAFFVITLWTLPSKSLTTIIFVVAIVGMILCLLIMQWLYVTSKENNYKLLNYAFFALTAIPLLFAIIDKQAFAMNNRKQVVKMNEDYIAKKTIFMESLGINNTVINAEDIYSGRCAACHKAEDAPTAPAHKNIIDKYLKQADPKAALVKFIMSPTKVNPAYPPMPNQGLTPAEAEAVAEFMVNKYSKK